MARYRLSPLRSAGWKRAGLIASVITVPLALMAYSLGFFSDGLLGLEQAGEFILGGILLSQIIGQSAAWILRGFAQRTIEEGEDGDESDSRAAARPSAASPDNRSQRPRPQRALPRSAVAGASRD